MATPKRPLRVGAIGVGGMGGAHLRAAHALVEDFEIVAVCDANPSARESAARTCDATPYEDYHALYERDDLDAVLVTLPHRLYREVVAAALERNLHVFKEKPLARTLADAAYLRDLARERERIVLVAGQSKYLPSYIEAKRLLDEGAIGSVFLASGVITYRWGGAVQNRWGWRGVHAESGGVAIIDSGWHVLDLLHWYRGTPERVYATVGTMRAAPQSDYDVDDKAVLALDYPDGGIGSVTITFVAQPSEKRIVLYGTDGTLDVRDDVLHRWEGDRVETVTLPSAPDALEAQLRHFARAVRGEEAPIADADRAFAIQWIVDAAYRSAAAGMPIS